MTAPTAGLEAAYDHELKALDKIRHDARRRGQLAHYSDLAAAASVPELTSALRFTTAWLRILVEHLEGMPSLHPESVDYWQPLIENTATALARCDDALGRRS